MAAAVVVVAVQGLLGKLSIIIPMEITEVMGELVRSVLFQEALLHTQVAVEVEHLQERQEPQQEEVEPVGLG